MLFETDEYGFAKMAGTAPKVPTGSSGGRPTPGASQPGSEIPDTRKTGPRGGEPQKSIVTPKEFQEKTEAQQVRTELAAKIVDAIESVAFTMPDSAAYLAQLDQWEANAQATYNNLMKGINLAKAAGAYFNGQTDSLNKQLVDAAILMLADLAKGQSVYSKLQEGRGMLGKGAWKARTGMDSNVGIPDHAFTWLLDPEDPSTNYWACPLVPQGDGVRDSQGSLSSYAVGQYRNSVFGQVWKMGGTKIGAMVGAEDPYPPWKVWLNFPMQLPIKKIKHEGDEYVSPSVVGCLAHIPEVRDAVAAALALLVKKGQIPQGKVIPKDDYFDAGYNFGFGQLKQVPGSEWIKNWNTSSDKYYRSLSPDKWEFLLAFPFTDQQAQAVCQNPGSKLDPNAPPARFQFYVRNGVKYPCGFPQSYQDFVVAVTQFAVNEFNKFKCWTNLTNNQAAEAYKHNLDEDLALVASERARVKALQAAGPIDVQAELAKVYASIPDPALVPFAKWYASQCLRADKWKPQATHDPASLVPVPALPEGAVINLEAIGKKNGEAIDEVEKLSAELKGQTSPNPQTLAVFQDRMRNLELVGAPAMRAITANEYTVAKGWKPDPDAQVFVDTMDFPKFPKEIGDTGLGDYGSVLRSRIDAAGQGPDVLSFQQAAGKFDKLQTRYDEVLAANKLLLSGTNPFDDTKITPPPSNSDGSKVVDPNPTSIKSTKETTETVETKASEPNWLLLAAAAGAAVFGAPVVVPAALGALALLGGKKADDKPPA